MGCSIPNQFNGWSLLHPHQNNRIIALLRRGLRQAWDFKYIPRCWYTSCCNFALTTSEISGGIPWIPKMAGWKSNWQVHSTSPSPVASTCSGLRWLVHSSRLCWHHVKIITTMWYKYWKKCVIYDGLCLLSYFISISFVDVLRDPPHDSAIISCGHTGTIPAFGVLLGMFWAFAFRMDAFSTEFCDNFVMWIMITSLGWRFSWVFFIMFLLLLYTLEMTYDSNRLLPPMPVVCAFGSWKWWENRFVYAPGGSWSWPHEWWTSIGAFEPGTLQYVFGTFGFIWVLCTCCLSSCGFVENVAAKMTKSLPLGAVSVCPGHLALLSTFSRSPNKWLFLLRFSIRVDEFLVIYFGSFLKSYKTTMIIQ